MYIVALVFDVMFDIFGWFDTPFVNFFPCFIGMCNMVTAWLLHLPRKFFETIDHGGNGTLLALNLGLWMWIRIPQMYFSVRWSNIATGNPNFSASEMQTRVCEIFLHLYIYCIYIYMSFCMFICIYIYFIYNIVWLSLLMRPYPVKLSKSGG